MPIDPSVFSVTTFKQMRCLNYLNLSRVGSCLLKVRLLENGVRSAPSSVDIKNILLNSYVNLEQESLIRYLLRPRRLASEAIRCDFLPRFLAVELSACHALLSGAGGQYGQPIIAIVITVLRPSPQKSQLRARYHLCWKESCAQTRRQTFLS
jgi:hypothetical protein